MASSHDYIRQEVGTVLAHLTSEFYLSQFERLRVGESKNPAIKNILLHDNISRLWVGKDRESEAS